MAPLLRSDMLASLRVLRTIPQRNQGRDREENNLAGMLRFAAPAVPNSASPPLPCVRPLQAQCLLLPSRRTLKADELEQIYNAVQKRADGDIGDTSSEVEAVALAWRAALLADDADVLSRVAALAVENAGSPRELMASIRAARKEADDAAAAEAGAAEDGKGDEEAAPEGAEVLPEFAAELAELRGGNPVAAGARPPRAPTRARRELLQMLRPLAATHLATTTAEHA